MEVLCIKWAKQIELTGSVYNFYKVRLKNVTIQLSFCSFQGKSCEILELSV